MGLDTFATSPGAGGEWEHAPDEPFEGIRLVGGMYSGGTGSSSIRGKVYDEVVLEATGESLYQERIEPAQVVEIARRLRAAVEDAKRTGAHAAVRESSTIDEHGRLLLDESGRPRIESQDIPALAVAGCEIDAGEAEGLARWFEVCAEHGYAVEGWW